jgi:serine/threonine protein kinase
VYHPQILGSIGFRSHSNNLIQQKPDNLGFDARGVVKMFDFGLTKELKDEDRNPDGLYRLTGFTGSIRYMAPEVGLRRPYNEKADVYSFSMLLWYILALEPPYGFYTPDMFLQRVFIQGHRPMNFPEWPDQLNIMIKRGWDNRINVRPDFKIIMQVIKKETVKVDAEAGARMVLFNRPVQQTTTHDGR